MLDRVSMQISHALALKKSGPSLKEINHEKFELIKFLTTFYGP